MADLKVAVVGSGYWGKNLVRNFHELGALDRICDSSPDTLDSFRERYPDTQTCVSYAEVLNSGVDGVVIATPAESHFRLANEALLADKHVYVEKPLVLDEGDAVRLIELAAERKRILMVGHLLQYHPAFIRLGQMVASGELGRINYIYSNRLNLGKIRREENALWSFAPHDISMILTLAGEGPESVQAVGGNYLHKAIADVTTTHMEFASGLKSHIFVSWLHPFKEQKLVVVGQDKMAVFDDTRPWEEKLLLYPHRINWQGNAPIPDKAEAERVAVEPAEPLRRECQQFLESMRTGKAPLTCGQEGLAVLRVLNAAQRSLDRGGEKVLLGRDGTAGSSSNFVHSSAYVDDGVELGGEVSIWHFSHVLTGSTIGRGCKIGQNVVIGPDVSVGSGCKIQNNVSVYKGVTLEENVFCGPSVVFTNVHNPRCEIPRMGEIKPTLVRRGATLGANSTIVCGTTIGRYSFVGAGAVVTGNIPDHALVVGNPARQKGWVCECGVRLDESLACPGCGVGYEYKDGALSRGGGGRR